MADPIHIWRFRDAPPELQALSQHGGGEDWLAMIPPEMLRGNDLSGLFDRLGPSMRGTGERISVCWLKDRSEVHICGH